MAIRLAKRENRDDVTAMPLGLDTPSTIGIAFTVLGPTYLETRDAILTWQVGMATMIIMGIIKVITSFCGDFIRRNIAQAGLLGSIGGIGLCLLAYLPIVKMFSMPVVGFVSMGIILFTLVARLHLPREFPGAFAAVLAGTLIYYIFGPMGLTGGVFEKPSPDFIISAPLPTAGFIYGFDRALHYLPIAIPFGILTIIGGINVTESARIAGDNYRTRDILLTEALATLAAGFCGGVIQSTPYIGHPAYKAMGGRAGYTLLTALFIGLGGILGYASFIVKMIPVTAVFPILLFIGIEIAVQAFDGPPKKHMPAVVFSFLPILAYLVTIEFAGILDTINKASLTLPPETGETVKITKILGSGFIITSMLWGAMVAELIDKNARKASFYTIICALLTLFGMIHSVSADGGVYLPWNVPSNDTYFIAASYCILGLIFVIPVTKKT
jgi:AGZA family xanthine/uracil permease-like MFS transporter